MIDPRTERVGAAPAAPAHDDSTPPRPVGRSRRQILALSVLSVGTWIVLDRLALGETGQFHLYGLPGLVWYGLPVVLIAWAVGRTTTPRLTFPHALKLVLGTVPLILIASFLLAGDPDAARVWFADGSRFVAWLVIAAVLLLALLKASTGRVQWPGVAVAVVMLLGFCWVDEGTYVNASLWYPMHEPEDAYEESWERTEELLFSQAERIDQAVDAMVPRAGPSSAFFVGFAGYAEEKVFANEIRYAADVLGSRYHSTGRTLLLLNDYRSLDHDPLATVSGLDYGLHRIAEKMDRENDLLILALSSHGSASPALAVSNGALPLNDLDGVRLRAALDDAGIRWRLLVISACYAGSFIDGLSSPYSAIITSAAPDKTSFGCSNERDLTYFGEAFYRDALPEAPSLREAFGLAKQYVTQREREAGYEPSAPVAFFGESIEEKLAALVAPRS